MKKNENMNPVILRKQVKKIENKIRSITEKKGSFAWWKNEENVSNVRLLLAERANCLNRMFLATPIEIKAFEHINNLFLIKGAQMRERAALLHQTLESMKTMSEFDDKYDIMAEMRVLGDKNDEDSILKLPEDDHYASDFLLAADVLGILKEKTGMPLDGCSYFINAKDLGTRYDNPGESFTENSDDGTNWAEGPLCHPALRHISICHAVYDLCIHGEYSIPDIIRINDIEITVNLGVTNRFTRDNIRLFDPEIRYMNS